MKRMIIIGVCLVTAAIVYGFVDYLQTDKKQLERMYNDEPAAAVPAVTHPVPAAAKTPAGQPEKTAPAAVDISTLNESEKAIVHGLPKKLRLEDYSRAVVEKFVPVDSIESEKAVNASLPEMKKPAAPRVEAIKTNIGGSPSIASIRKKLDYRLFSRAPLKKVAVVRDTADSAAAVQAKN